MRYTIRRRTPLTWTVSSVLAVAALAIVASCDVTAPMPAGATPLTIPAHYSTWWSMVEQCSGRTRPMRDIDWYVVPERTSGKEVDGLYRSTGQVVLSNYVVRDGPVVRHEMLHAILQRKGSDAVHDAEYFRRRCSGLVDCRLACIETSGAPQEYPPASTPLVSVNQLEVSVEVDSVVSLARYPDVAYVAVIVRVRNPSSTNPVQVELRRFNGYRMSFELAIDAPVPALTRIMKVASDEMASGYFKPGESKVHVFDVYLPVNGAGMGLWSVTGGFSGKWMNASVPFRFTP